MCYNRLTRKKEVIEMKILRFLVVIGMCIGILLMFGGVGGLENETATLFQACAISGAGLCLFAFCGWLTNELY